MVFHFDYQAEFMERAVCHEAGHTVVALHLGFTIKKIEIEERRPKLTFVNSAAKTCEENCTALAGGIASEKILYGYFDREACKSDRCMCLEMGGRDLEYYLPDASRIIELNKTSWLQFREELRSRWEKRNDEVEFDSDPNSFPLLSGKEIMDIWRASKPRGEIEGK